MNFNQLGLDARLLAGIKRAGYETPTPIQAAALPEALAGRDIIGIAQTGTGKTAAFVLPILQKLLNGPRDRMRALIVTPTRELAEQTHRVIRSLGHKTGLDSATIYGGVNASPQIKALRAGTEIIVACPGRLLDHIKEGHAVLESVEMLVLDEADRMFDMGFLPDVRRIIKQVPVQRQTMLFAATFPPEVEDLATQTLRRPKRIALGLVRPAHTVSHAIYPVQPHLKTALLLALLQETRTESVLIFTRTKHRAQRLAQQIGRKHYTVTSLHSNRSQNQRQAALDGFKGGKYQIMVATDVAARGLDVETISHVINFDMPDTADAYIHRIGRTGRAERTGDAYTLVTSEDANMVRALEKIMGQPLPRHTLAGFDYNAQPANSGDAQPAPRSARPAHPKASANGDKPASQANGHRARRKPSGRPQRGRPRPQQSGGGRRGR